MGFYKNTTDGPVRVDDGNGNLRRVPPGAVVEASGDFESNLSSREGIEGSSADEYGKSRTGVVGDDPSSDVARMEKVVEGRAVARMQAIAVPLNEVVGDDDAPYGPGNGTITTKQALAREGGDERRAFADHEALPEDAENENVSDVHRAQAENRKAVEEATERAQSEGTSGSAVETPPAPPATTSRQKRASSSES